MTWMSSRNSREPSSDSSLNCHCPELGIWTYPVNCKRVNDWVRWCVWGGWGVLVRAAGGVRQHLESQGHSVQSQCKGIADNHQLYPLDIAPIRG